MFPFFRQNWKRGLINYLGERLVTATKEINDDIEHQARIENTVDKLLTGLATVNTSACPKNDEYKNHDRYLEGYTWSYAPPVGSSEICDLAVRVPMKIRSWNRLFGCEAAYEKKYMKQMRNQASRKRTQRNIPSQMPKLLLAPF